jgi:hypothetical protein
MQKQIFWENVTVGQEIPPLTKIATTLELVKWAGAYGDYNPLHYDNDFAISFMKTSGVIVHGTLKRQWLIQMMTDWIGTEGWLKRIQTQFRAMDYPRRMKNLGAPHDGESWQCKGRVTGKSKNDSGNTVECDIWLENGKGEITTMGTATVLLPTRE